MGFDVLLVAVVVWLPVLHLEWSWFELVLTVVIGLELKPRLLVEQLVAPRLVTMPVPNWRPWIGHNHCSENRSGEVYLIGHQGMNALKIGVAGPQSDRLEQHFALGWILRDLWGFESLTDAYLTEEAVLDRWRNLYGQQPWLCRTDLPQGGWTETLRWTSANELEIRRFVREKWREAHVPNDCLHDHQIVVP